MFVPSKKNYVKFPSYYSFQENVGCILKPLLTMISCTPTHRSDMKFPALKLYKCNKCPKNCRRGKKNVRACHVSCDGLEFLARHSTPGYVAIPRCHLNCPSLHLHRHRPLCPNLQLLYELVSSISSLSR